MAEAAKDGRGSLAMARELGHPAAEALALMDLSEAALNSGDLGAALQLARQAAQVPADVPGWIARLRSLTLSDALLEAGDLAGAINNCAAGLDRSRDAGDVRIKTKLLMQMAYLHVRAGRSDDAALHLRESLDTAARTGGWADVLNCLDVCGYLCAGTGRRANAVTVWAAHAALLRHEGGADWPVDARRRQEALGKAQQTLGPVRARVAEERGAAMSLATAAEYALLLTAPGPPPPPPGPGMLSAREWELVTLVAQGRTNAQIAAELYISVRTVGSHLDQIRDKTGCRRRADLTRLALTEGLV
jgi:DNA-binding CsgD family transcriptional regulator